MKYSIGRNEDNDLVLSDKSVSGNHAEIIISDDYHTYTLTDLKSTNGTYIDNRRIVSKKLAANQELRFGNHLYMGEKLIELLKSHIKEVRTDFSKEFEELLSLENDFQKKRRNINKNYRIIIALPKLIVTILVVLAIYLIPNMNSGLRYPLMIGATLFGTIISTLGISEQKKEDKLNILRANFQLHFKCPKCDTELYSGSRDGSYYKERGKCINQRCNATWKVK